MNSTDKPRIKIHSNGSVTMIKPLPARADLACLYGWVLWFEWVDFLENRK